MRNERRFENVEKYSGGDKDRHFFVDGKGRSCRRAVLRIAGSILNKTLLQVSLMVLYNAPHSEKGRWLYSRASPSWTGRLQSASVPDIDLRREKKKGSRGRAHDFNRQASYFKSRTTYNCAKLITSKLRLLRRASRRGAVSHYVRVTAAKLLSRSESNAKVSPPPPPPRAISDWIKRNIRLTVCRFAVSRLPETKSGTYGLIKNDGGRWPSAVTPRNGWFIHRVVASRTPFPESDISSNVVASYNVSNLERGRESFEKKPLRSAAQPRSKNTTFDYLAIIKLRPNFKSCVSEAAVSRAVRRYRRTVKPPCVSVLCGGINAGKR